MKNVILSLAFIMISSFAFANESNEIQSLNKSDKRSDKEIIVENSNEDCNDDNVLENEAIYCRVRVSNDLVGTMTFSCWFCDCGSLAEHAQDIIDSYAP
jgi:hypothetical protein